MGLNFWRSDPGPCIVRGAAHSACTAGGGDEIAIVQMPLRDAVVAATVNHGGTVSVCERRLIYGFQC